MFPQLGAPLGFLCSTSVFLLISDRRAMPNSSPGAGACRSSPVRRSCSVGLYVRLRLAETPASNAPSPTAARARADADGRSRGTRELLLGPRRHVTTFVVFYLMTVFALSWATERYHYTRARLSGSADVGVLFWPWLSRPRASWRTDRAATAR